MSDQLLKLYESIQSRMQADLAAARATEHAPTSGAGAEHAWIKFLQRHLPKRYAVDSAFVVDCHGHKSDQIDVVIYDPQYTPRIFDLNGVLWLPAESVYAVFEAKPELKGNVLYAGKKAASVRNLHRTSAEIVHAGGTYPPRPLTHILGGILTDRTGWKTDPMAHLSEQLAELADDQRLDIGCCAESIAFSVAYGGEPRAEVGVAGFGLIDFLTRLVGSLQALGTVPSIEFAKYMVQIELASEEADVSAQPQPGQAVAATPPTERAYPYTSVGSDPAT